MSNGPTYQELLGMQDGTLVNVVGEPNSYHIANIVGGTRVAYVTLCIEGGNVGCRVQDPLVASTAVALTSAGLVSVSGRLTVMHFDDGEPEPRISVYAAEALDVR